jgi:hypothetical protein
MNTLPSIALTLSDAEASALLHASRMMASHLEKRTGSPEGVPALLRSAVEKLEAAQAPAAAEGAAARSLAGLAVLMAARAAVRDAEGAAAAPEAAAINPRAVYFLLERVQGPRAAAGRHHWHGVRGHELGDASARVHSLGALAGDARRELAGELPALSFAVRSHLLCGARFLLCYRAGHYLDLTELVRERHDAPPASAT